MTSVMNSMGVEHSFDPRTVSQYPITTGTSVLGIKYKDGVMIAADMQGSYGSLRRHTNVSRVSRVNDTTILGFGGDIADSDFLTKIVEQKVISDDSLNDGFNLKPKSLHCWLTRFLYNRRSKFDPLWTTFVVGGIQDGKSFLGYVDKIGTAYEDDTIATGYGNYLARPIMGEEYKKNPNMSEQEAKDILIKCMTNLFYRDTRAFDRYQIAIVTSSGARVEGPFELKSNWQVGHLILN